MRSSPRYIFLLTAFLTVSGARANPDSLLIEKTADSLSNAGDHYTASLYYQKAAWFSQDLIHKANCMIKGSDELKILNDFKTAARLLSEINPEGLPDSIIFKIKYNAALYSYLNSEFTNAESFLFQIQYLVKDSVLNYDTYLLNALIFNEQFRWEEARTKLQRLNQQRNNSNDSSFKKNEDLIANLYHREKLPKIKRKDKAVKMSTFFPGLGQTYAGYPGEGLISFGSLLVTSGAIVFGIINQYYFTSVVLGNVVIAKFYQGGLTRTEYLVDKRNYLNTYKFNSTVKKQLVEAFKK